MTDAVTILIADNNRDFLDIIRHFLEQEEYRVIPAYDPSEAEEILLRGGIDVAIFDLRLINDGDDKDISGLNLARRTDPSVPKIIFTQYPTYEAAREALAPQLVGLPPAVEFVGKPEGHQALLTAVRKALTIKDQLVGTKEIVTTPIASHHDFWLDEKNKQVIVENVPIDLTPQELSIIRHFLSRPNEVLPLEEIVQQALGSKYNAATEENRVRNIILRIRQKIEVDPRNPKYLQNVRGYGYKLVLD